MNIPGIGSITGETLRLGVGMGRKADGDVRTIQTLLDDLGFDLGEAGVDGRFGPDTARAVRDLQAKYGLAVDGVVGPETKALLKRIARRHLRRRERLDVDSLVSEAATPPETTTWETRMATIEKRLEEAVTARKAARGGTAFAQARAREMKLRQQLAEAQFAHFDSGDGAFHTVICDGCKKSGGLRKLAEVPLGGKMAVEFKCDCGHLTRVLNNSLEYVVPGRSSEANATRPPMQEAADSMVKASTHKRGLERKRGDQDNWVERTGPGGKGGQLPAYIQHIALALVRRRGMDRSRAIAIAIGTVKRWARGGDRVDENTRAAARKALAEWEAMKAKAHAS